VHLVRRVVEFWSYEEGSEGGDGGCDYDGASLDSVNSSTRKNYEPGQDRGWELSYVPQSTKSTVWSESWSVDGIWQSC
jgi:hypothetical protein